MGIMIGCPQRRQGSVDNGGKSPGMKTLASQPGQVTIFNGLSLIRYAVCGSSLPARKDARRLRGLAAGPVGGKPSPLIPSSIAGVKAENTQCLVDKSWRMVFIGPA